MRRMFHCEGCQQDFETDQPIEDVTAKGRVTFPGVPDEDMGDLCDNCWKKAESAGLVPLRLNG
jgi:uncharacterized protein (DUF2237 family)